MPWLLKLQKVGAETRPRPIESEPNIARIDSGICWERGGEEYRWHCAITRTGKFKTLGCLSVYCGPQTVQELQRQTRAEQCIKERHVARCL